jgi:peptidoglycan/LPS O-acetylase OafA/YrhL
MTDKKSSRFYSLDLIRFMAAVSVLCYHYLFIFPPKINGLDGIPYYFGSFFKYGHLGVNIFFMISGFVIYMSSEGKRTRDFVVSRITRLYPAYILAVILTSMFTIPNPDIYYPSDIENALVNLTMLQKFLGYRDVDGVYWTLAIEIVFYFWIAVFMIFRQIHRTELIIFIWYIISLINFVYPFPEILRQIMLLKWISYFGAGMVFYRCWRDGFTIYRVISLCLSLYLSQIYSFERNEIVGHDFGVEFNNRVNLFMNLFFYVLFAMIVSGKEVVKNPKFIIRLGSLTYPLYLIHQNIGMVIFKKTASTFDNPILLIGLVTILMLAVSVIIVEFVEKPISKVLKPFLRKLLR